VEGEFGVPVYTIFGFASDWHKALHANLIHLLAGVLEPCMVVICSNVWRYEMQVQLVVQMK